jgi:hypothetical protein
MTAAHSPWAHTSWQLTKETLVSVKSGRTKETGGFSGILFLVYKFKFQSELRRGVNHTEAVEATNLRSKHERKLLN